MQVQSIQNNNYNPNFQHRVDKEAPFFGPVKNTFKRQIAIATADHLEAKARLHYKKFRKAEQALYEINNPFNSVKGVWQLIKSLSSMAYHKWQSVDYIAESHHYRHMYDDKLINRSACRHINN